MIQEPPSGRKENSEDRRLKEKLEKVNKQILEFRQLMLHKKLLEKADSNIIKQSTAFYNNFFEFINENISNHHRHGTQLIESMQDNSQLETYKEFLDFYSSK